MITTTQLSNIRYGDNHSVKNRRVLGGRRGVVTRILRRTAGVTEISEGVWSCDVAAIRAVVANPPKSIIAAAKKAESAKGRMTDAAENMAKISAKARIAAQNIATAISNYTDASSALAAIAASGEATADTWAVASREAARTEAKLILATAAANAGPVAPASEMEIKRAHASVIRAIDAYEEAAEDLADATTAAAPRM